VNNRNACDERYMGRKNRRDTLVLIGVVLVLAALAFFLAILLNPGYSREPYQQREIDVLDDVVTITAYGKNQSRVEGAVEDAFGEIYRVDEIADRYNPDSEIARLNASAAAGPVAVSEELWEMIAAGMEIHEASGGLFDITVGPLVDLWDVTGRAERGDAPPSQEEIGRAMELVGVDKLVLDEEAHSVYFTREGMILDLGGLAKGYALDRAKEALISRGIEAAVIDMISTAFVLGDKPEGAGGPQWKFAIQDPRAEGRLAELLLDGNTYFSTSGDNQRNFEYEGVTYHHILDPRTGYPARRAISVTVVGGENGAWSDAMSTAAFIVGYPDGLRWAEDVEGVGIVLVDPDGFTHVTPWLQGSIVNIKAKAGAEEE
jgi:FAD:protein FMN transferase